MNSTEFYNAIKTNDSLTANGAVTHSTSNNACLNLFFLVGASRGKNIFKSIFDAYYENKELCTRIMLWSRDIRQGAGERKHMHTYMKFLISIPDHETLNAITLKMPELGRWDDIFGMGKVTITAGNMVKKALDENDALCAKWMPRENSSKSNLSKQLRKHLNLTPKEYRKLLSKATKVVETNLCEKDYTFDYAHVPSKAQLKYTKAFYRNDESRYREYLESLNKGETKVNAGAVYPNEILYKAFKETEDIANPMWKAMPDWLQGENSILPVIDISGSMGDVDYYNCTANAPIYVSLALGMYIAQRNKGDFAGLLMTFCGDPELCKIPTINKEYSLKNIVKLIYKHASDASTNLLGVFELLLDKLVDESIKQEDMPKTLLIISDMEFNSVNFSDITNFNAIDKMYKDAGYTRPDLVFWNVNGRSTNIPIKINDTGTALISGFSPSILKSVLTGNINPLDIMMKTVMADRYDY